VEATEGLRYHASIPLYFRDRPLGIMNLTRKDYQRLTREELRLLSTIAGQAGAAIERARLAEASTQFARVQERTRFARDMHDTLTQGLTAITLNLEGALNQLDHNPQRARDRLEVALTTARESLDDARRSMQDLRADGPARPLPEALDAMARGFTAQTGVRVRTQVDRTVTLPLRAEEELFRIAQEALANIRQHAHATNAEIALRGKERSATLTVRDNGAGFDASIRREGHLGLIGMKERARLLGGRLRVTSRPGKGTVITASIPLRAGTPT
jgi:two-component system, NarL family, sensor kinase